MFWKVIGLIGTMCLVVDAQEMEAQKREEIEAAQTRLLLKSMTGESAFLAAYIELVPTQRELIEEALKTMEASEAELEKQQRNDRFDATIAIELDEGGVAAARDKLNKLDRNRTKQLSEHNSRILETILVPVQATRLNEIVRQKVLRAQASASDEFEIPLIIATDLGLEESEKAKIRTAIALVREEYETKLKDLREKSTKEAFKAIPAQVRTTLLDMMGEPYDYNAELAASAESSGIKKLPKE